MQKLEPPQRGDTNSKALRESERERKESRSAEPRQTSVGSRRRPPDPDVSCVRWCSEPAVINSVRQTGLERERVHACMHACNGHVYIYGNGLPVWASLDMHMHSVLKGIQGTRRISTRFNWVICYYSKGTHSCTHRVSQLKNRLELCVCVNNSYILIIISLKID
jgi:hypothetical protein